MTKVFSISEAKPSDNGNGYSDLVIGYEEDGTPDMVRLIYYDDHCCWQSYSYDDIVPFEQYLHWLPIPDKNGEYK